MISKFSSTFSPLSMHCFGTLVSLFRVIPNLPIFMIFITDPFKQKSVLYFSCINARPLKLPYFDTMQNILCYDIRFTPTVTNGKHSSVMCIIQLRWILLCTFQLSLSSKVQKELFLARKTLPSRLRFPCIFFLAGEVLLFSNSRYGKIILSYFPLF